MQFTQVKVSTSNPAALTRFYVDALDCEVVLPLTTLEPRASLGAGVSGPVDIVVLSLPGADGGPTLELISAGDRSAGPAYLTFLVDDVRTAAAKVVDAGGSFRGEITDLVGPSGRTSRFVFMADPEGNVIDLFQAVD